ncbi:hypothetical protein ACQKDD_18145 [Planococcus kocurii]|uniref:hypothetical protein n=1 Tax=Bacillati TaxID=1783272 RepID=UPI003401FF1D
MIPFDRIEKSRLYLGVAQVELDFILNILEKYEPENEHTKRLDALAMVLHREQLKYAGEKRDENTRI